ncbi:ATP-binding protein [Chitinibacteraceae bacterium HSL-7]
MPPRLRPFAMDVLLFVGLLVSGRLALLLAIPPGYASPIWPPAGIALAAVLLFGRRALPTVFLASLALNYAISTGSELVWRPSVLLPCALIALGSTAQAVLAAWLCRRFVSAGEQPKLARPREILKFFALSGALACVVAPSMGVGSLLALGLMPELAAVQSWLTWWVGDTLGVTIVSPLVLCCLARPRRYWRSRMVTVATPLLFALALLVAMALAVLGNEQRRMQQGFDGLAAALTSSLSTSLMQIERSQLQLADLFQTPEFVTRQHFANYTRGILLRQRELLAISWAPRIQMPELADAERIAERMGRHGFEIRELDGTALKPAASRSFYDPIWYIEPEEKFQHVIGLDMSSEPVRRDTVARAQQRGYASVSGRVQLAGKAGWGVLLGLPAIAPLQPGGAKHAGVLISVLSIDKLVELTFGSALHKDVQIELRDLDHSDELLYASPVLVAAPTLQPLVQELSFADRTWRLMITPSRSYELSHGSWLPWLLLIGGLVCASFFSLFLLAWSARTADVEDEVRLRTSELDDSNRRLQQENAQRQDTERQLRDLVTQAEAASLAKSQFLANMSHEIRTPMNGIVGMAQLLAQSRLNEEQSDQVRMLGESAQSLLVIINDILDYSKVEAGKLTLALEDFDPARLMEETVALYRQPASAQHVELLLNLSPHVTPVSGDPVRVRQIVGNLLSNAIKFGRGQPVVVGLKQDEQGALVITIKDHGIGMSDEVVESLFQPFFQAEAGSTRRFGGTGLGLSICRSLAELMGGTIHVTSEVGVGSEFVLRLPLAAAGSAVPERPQAPALQRFDGRQVLVVDDNPINLKVAGLMLEKLGIDVVTAMDGAEALARCRATRFDLVLMDCQMPVLDGYAATEQLRGGAAGEHYLDAPIIAMTANAMSGDRERCLAAGMDELLPKPVLLPDLQTQLALAFSR